VKISRILSSYNVVMNTFVICCASDKCLSVVAFSEYSLTACDVVMILLMSILHYDMA
jgi:hypothetical protein